MITPLMYILSCMGPDYRPCDPVSVSSLNASDQHLICAEALRLCSLVTNHNTICSDETVTGKRCVFTSQAVSGQLVEISPLTAYTLQHIRDCATTFMQRVGDISANEQAAKDLSSDTIALHIEGNPQYAFAFVYETMMSKESYERRINRIADVYRTISEHATPTTETDGKQQKEQRLELQSKMSYWKRLWLLDSLVFDGQPFEEQIDERTFSLVRDELKKFGLTGFVNPLKMYTEFSTNRVGRKETVSIPDDIVLYLERVVRSGGVSV